MKINKTGIWISGIYSLIQFSILMFAKTLSWVTLLCIYSVAPSMYLLDLLGLGVSITNTTIVWLSIATAFQIYAICHFVGYLYRKKS